MCFIDKTITSKNTEAVTLFIQRGFVSPDVPDASPGGRTPLIAAVEAGNGAMVCTLIALGATVNGYGTLPSLVRPTTRDYLDPRREGDQQPGRERTPLMVAASRGNLALVKLLMEDFHADDGIIAPDGQLALRLAADGEHRDVVAYLPVRRGGAWRRWRTHHDVAVKRVQRAGWKIFGFFKVLLWDVPRFFLWTVPKYWRVKRAGKAVWKGVKKVPKGVWRVAKEVPRVVERLLKWLWKVVKRIPEAMKMVCVWIWETLKRFGKAVGHVFLRVIAVLHTAVAAVLDFFRNIKLKDVWNGVCDVFKSVFFGLPKVLLKAVATAGLLVAGVIVALFGCAGKLVLFLFEALWWVAKYVPRQFGEIISGIWASIAKGYHEIMVWINPKH
ncbi:hypothetical protein N0V88_006695 [Collariella sp. IMI 366227]|nr:hypothetical protein N0V88_006695 [Collariella sp. IMI 366227]